MAASRLWLASSSKSPFWSREPTSLVAAWATASEMRMAKAARNPARNRRVIGFVFIVQIFNWLQCCKFHRDELSCFCKIGGSFLVALIVVRQFQFVADTVDGLDPAGVFGVWLNFGAEAGDVIVHRARRGEGGVAPDDVEKTLAGHRFAGSFEQQPQHGELLGGEMERFAAAHGGLLREINAGVAEGERRGRAGLALE